MIAYFSCRTRRGEMRRGKTRASHVLISPLEKKGGMQIGKR